MKAIDVRFSSGLEALNAYWGHLTGGGLSFPSDSRTTSSTLSEGQTVDIKIQIASQPQFTVRGRVIRRRPERTFVAFADGGAKDRLLRAAASDDLLDREALEAALVDA